MSNVKRKDGKNRNLRNGESQRKDGRYVYKYTDIYGKPQFIYSWKLVPTDKTPAGKRDDISLREKEAQIKKDLNDGIDTVGGKMTVCQLYDCNRYLIYWLFDPRDQIQWRTNDQSQSERRHPKIG